MKTINKHIIQASKNLKTIQKQSLTIREDYLKEKVQEAKIDGNKKHYQYLSNLVIIEHQKQMYRRIKHYTHQRKSSGIKYLEIPIDNSIPWNNIPSTLTADQWNCFDNPEDIERCLISRNRAHLSQAQGTPFTIHPLKELLGKDSLTPFGNSLLLGTADLDIIPLTSLQKLYLSELRKSSFTLSSPLHHRISLADTTQGFKSGTKVPLHPHQLVT